MKRSHLVTTATVAVLLVVGLALSGVVAQTRTTGAPAAYPAQTTVGPVALIDISKVFKEHHRFNEAMTAMRAKVDRAEEQMQKDVEALRQWMEERDKFKKGSTDYNEWDRRIAERKSEINIQMQMSRKEFLQEEARIYHQIYREIEYHVGSWASRNRISVVLRFNSAGVEDGSPEDVLRFINKPVVWHAPAIDITATIIQSLNARSGIPQGADRRPSIPYPTQR